MFHFPWLSLICLFKLRLVQVSIQMCEVSYTPHLANRFFPPLISKKIWTEKWKEYYNEHLYIFQEESQKLVCVLNLFFI